MAKAKKKAKKVAHMIMVEGRGVPSKVHESFDDAHIEAQRLAIKEPQRLIRIFQIVHQLRGEIHAVNVPIVLPDDDETPF